MKLQATVRVQKMVSVLASMATEAFMSMGDDYNYPALFDCRVWQVPTLEEAANVFVWREQDATRNSISMLASCHYSHKQLHKKNSADMHEMLHKKGVNWNDCPVEFKRGSYIQRRKVFRELGEDERMKIPEKHRPPKDQKVERTQVARLDMPILTTVTNRVQVLVYGETPVVEVGT